jgi:FkbM family methyltransferase
MIKMIVESWDGFKWWVEKESDRVPLSKGEISCLRALYIITDRLSCKVFVDVGANLGHYTIRMAKRCEKVIAFEPNPENRRKLLKNIELNRLDNVTVLPYACGEERYRSRITMEDSGSHIVDSVSEKETVEIDVVQLDEVVDEGDIVKIDVEGYEWNVIQGARNLIESCRPILLIEHHDWRHYRTNWYPFIKDYLKSLKYTEIFLTSPHRLWYPQSKPMEVIGSLVAHHWIQHCIDNLRSGRDWYIGLPYTWWWGYDFIDFIYEIPHHVTNPDEPLWIELLKR